MSLHTKRGRSQKILFVLVFLLAETFLLDSQPMKGNVLEKTMIEIGYGRYEISDPRYKKVYKEGREIYTIKVLQLFYSQNGHHVGITAGVKHFTKKGHSTVTQEETRLTIVPLSLGLRYLLKLNHFIPWSEIGLDYYHYKESATITTTVGWALGYHITGGIYFEIPKASFIKLLIYAKHTKAMAQEENIKVNLGGFEYGLGLSLGFNLY